MTEHNIYTKFIFKDKNNDQLLQELIVRNHANKFDCVRKIINELTEKFCLSENEISIEGN